MESDLFVALPNAKGINPYKQVEMHYKYGPQVPEEYQKNELYCEPYSKVMLLVEKVERSEQSVFRAKLKETKRAGMKERLESIAYFDDDGSKELVAGNDEEEESHHKEDNDSSKIR